MSAATQRTFLATDGDVTVFTPPPDGRRGVYHALAPSAALAPYVTSVHLGREDVPASAPIEERILPDGTVHLLFNLGAPPAVLHGAAAGPGGDVEAVGAGTRPVVIRMAGVVEHVGVRLRPGGIAALLGVPAGELQDRSVPLDLVWGGAAHELLERLAASPTAPARVALLETALLARLRRLPSRAQPHAGVPAALRLVRERRGRLRVAHLAAALGVGERRLGQLFHAHVGLPPKAALRLARFHAAVRLLQREPRRTLSDVAHACGWADQAHLTHDVRALSGLTPGALRTHLGCRFPQDAADDAA